MKKLLLVSIDNDDHELVARYASAMRLPSIDAGATRILAEWATKAAVARQCTATGENMTDHRGSGALKAAAPTGHGATRARRRSAARAGVPVVVASKLPAGAGGRRDRDRALPGGVQVTLRGRVDAKGLRAVLAALRP